MTRTHEKVSSLPLSERPAYTADLAAEGVQRVIDIIDGRWKLVILFQLFGGKVKRFSELERAIPGISQKMLAQQLRQLERDGVVTRIVYSEVPPRVEYRLTPWGQSLCPALDALLGWIEAAPATPLNLRNATPELSGSYRFPTAAAQAGLRLREETRSAAMHCLCMEQTPEDTTPHISAENARGGEIVLRSRRRRLLFVAGLIGLAVLAILVRLATLA